MESPKVNRKEMEKEARKKDILDAAATLFSENAFHDVKVDDIAEKVGLSKGTIYLYFENKEILFFSIIKDRSEKLFEKMKNKLETEASFEENLRRFIKTYLSFFQKHQAFFKIIQSNKIPMSMENHYEMHDWGMAAYQKYFKLIYQLIKKGQEQKVVRPMDPSFAVKILGGSLNSYMYYRIFIGSNTPLDEDMDMLIDLFLNGVKTTK